MQLLCFLVLREMFLIILDQLLYLFLQLFLRNLAPSRVVLHIYCRVLSLAGLVVVHELVHVVRVSCLRTG